MRPEYQYGSAALAPERVIDPERKYREERARRQKREEEHLRSRAHRNNLRASKIRAMTLLVGIVMVSSALFLFVFLQSQIADSKKNISRLEDQITQINALNDAAKSRIESAVNLTYVRNRAAQDMGMVYAQGDHVVFYEMNDTDYMTKY